MVKRVVCYAKEVVTAIRVVPEGYAENLGYKG